MLVVGLPEREIPRILLLFADLHARPALQIFHHLAREGAVLGELRHLEVHLALAVDVGIPALDQHLDHRQHLGHVVGGARVQRRIVPLVANVVLELERLGVDDEGPLEVRRDLIGILPELARRLGQLVLPLGVGEVIHRHVPHVGDVHDVPHRIPLRLEHAAQEIRHQEAAKIADVRVRIDGGATAVDGDRLARGIEGREGF